MTPEIATYLEFARQMVAPLPGIYEKLCFGTPAFYVGKFLLSRVREDGETITIQTFERDKWMTADPVAFFITDHYRNYDCMLINLKAVSPDDLKELLFTAWRNRASKRLIKDYDDGP